MRARVWRGQESRGPGPGMLIDQGMSQQCVCGRVMRTRIQVGGGCPSARTCARLFVCVAIQVGMWGEGEFQGRDFGSLGGESEDWGVVRTLDPGLQGICICVGRWRPRAEIWRILRTDVQRGVLRTRTLVESWGVLELDGKIESLGY